MAHDTQAAAPLETQPRPDRTWHATPASEIYRAFETHRTGLSSEEATRRLTHYGTNALPEAAARHPVLRFLAQFNNTLIYFLLCSAVAAWALGHAVDASVILAVVTINAIVGFIQEGKAEEALNAIRKLISPKASVLRDGHRTTLAATELVPGDVVLLEAGDQVAADLRLVRTRGLLIEEAVLTGESTAAEKHDTAVAPDAALGDRTSMAYSGTLVAAGQGAGVVVATGSATQIGRISTMMGGIEDLDTPLLRQINRFGRWFSLATFIGGALVFAFATLVRGESWDSTLLMVVALAVAAIPEGLPAVITITLAIGVQRMACRHAIIRHLPAVETLGSTSVICSDKTGTLTRNEMTARRIVTADHQLMVEGVGYEPVGSFAIDGNEIAAPPPIATRLVRSAVLCNDARLLKKGGQWHVEGDPMEGALVALAMKAGLGPDEHRRTWERIDEIPFDAEHRFMASLHRTPDETHVIFVKGAPERLLEMCTHEARHDGEAPLDKAYWADRIAEAASHGERILGFAWKPAASVGDLDFSHVENGLVFLGLAGFIDPPREEAIAAVAECRSAGIDVKMITGDHAATATAIAHQLGIADDPRVVTGAELEDVSDKDLPDLAEATNVFARTNPEHKLRIVRALQADGDIVAMTGDGVNDAPALKKADVGIAMGRKGTEAAKQAAQMVLVDDNFATIVAAVHEGRTVFDNIQKLISFALPTNGGLAFAVIAAMLFGFTLPATPVQILWINMITTITLALVLAFEPSEPGVMQRPPRPSGSSLLSGFLVWRVAFVSLLFVAGAMGIFTWAMHSGHDVATARTMAVNVLVVLQIFYLFNVRFLHQTSLTLRGALGTTPVLIALAVVVAAQFAFTYLPFMQALFDTRPLNFSDGLVVVATGVLLFLILEAEKVLFRRAGLLDSPHPPPRDASSDAV